jgi:hypothetical protein
MNKYERYSSRELFETAKTGPGNLRNYLIGLLLKREDREKYVKEMLGGGDRELLSAVLRLLSFSDATRFRSQLEGLLKSGEPDIKRTIVKRWGEDRDKNAIPALLGLTNDRGEDHLLKKIAIYSLGEIGDTATVAPLSRLFDGADADTKIAVLIALNKISREDARPVFIRASKDQSPDVRHWADEFLKNADGGELPDDRSILRAWTRNPVSYPDSDRLSFLSNGEGLYEEDKAGETTLLLQFRFRLETSGNIVFVSRSHKEYPTGYQVRKDLFRHPYKGNINCLKLEFADKSIEINQVTLTGSPYYWLAKGFT